MTDIRDRTAPERGADPHALAALHAACFDVPRPWRAEEFAALLDDPAVLFVRGESASHGFAVGRVAADDVELLTIAVAADMRRQGHGRRLLASFEAAALSRGALSAFLEVREGNAGAIALYAAAGYVERGRRPRYYEIPDGPAEDALILGRALG